MTRGYIMDVFLYLLSWRRAFANERINAATAAATLSGSGELILRPRLISICAHFAMPSYELWIYSMSHGCMATVANHPWPNQFFTAFFVEFYCFLYAFLICANFWLIYSAHAEAQTSPKVGSEIYQLNFQTGFWKFIPTSCSQSGACKIYVKIQSFNYAYVKELKYNLNFSFIAFIFKPRFLIGYLFFPEVSRLPIRRSNTTMLC